MRKPSGASPILNTNWLTIEDFELLCFNLAREFLTFQEPIPDYSTRNNALLESSLGSLQQTFGGKLLYPTLEKQGAILFYSLIKNHPFKNGNKRIAVIALLAFLQLNNNRWLFITPLDLYNLAVSVSKSKPSQKDQQLKKIERFIKKNPVPQKGTS